MNTILLDNLLTDDECDLLISSANQFTPALINDENSNYINNQYRKCELSLIDTQSNAWLIDRLFPVLKDINNDCFRYNISGITELQIIKYDVGSFYKKHLDLYTDESGYQRKLTFIIQLSHHDEYEEGDLIIHASDIGELTTRERGSIIVFPTYTLHEVTPIVSGTRYSMIGWCFGPEFQ